MTEFTDHETTGLTPDAIRDFPGLTQPQLNSRLAALAPENSVRLRGGPPPRCWIETPGGTLFGGDGANLNAAVEDALAKFEESLGHDVASSPPN